MDRKPISPEEADRLYDEAPADPISDAEVERLVKAVTHRGYIGDGLDVDGKPLTGRELAADLADGRSR